MIAPDHRPGRAARPDYWAHLAWASAGAPPLLAWRRAARLSVIDLAEISGIPADVITAIESRHCAVSVSQCARLAAALGLSPADLED